jgi:hypothetical protein
MFLQRMDRILGGRDSMATDFTISLFQRPGTLAAASSVLGQAGVNIEGQCAFISDGRGVYHVLVSNAEVARRALIDAGFDIQDERRVIVTPIDNEPGAAAALLSRVAGDGVEIDLVYVTAEGDLVLGGPDPNEIARALE